MFSKEEIIKQLNDLNNSVETGTFLDEDLSDSKLANLKLSNIIFKRCNFYVSSLYSCQFIACEFLDCNFESANILNVTFKDCNIVNNNFIKAKMQDVLIEGGFKTGNNFTNIQIVDNVKGLSEKDLSIIGDSIEGDSIFAKDWKKQGVNDSEQMIMQTEPLYVSFSKDKEMGQNTYRMTIFDSLTDDSIVSDTITIDADKKLTSDIVMDLFNNLYGSAYSKYQNMLKSLDMLSNKINSSLTFESIQTEEAEILQRESTMVNVINTLNKLSERVSDLQKKLQ